MFAVPGTPHRLASLLAISLCLMLLPPSGAVAAEAESVPVKAVPAPTDEMAPAADGSWFTWVRHPQFSDRWRQFAQRGDQDPIRVNARGTEVGPGGGIDGRKVIYQQIAPGSRRSGIYLFNLRTHQRVKLPPVVNTRHRESGPSLSGRFLVFERSKGSGVDTVRRVVLYNTRTDRVRVLATARMGPTDADVPSFEIGQVNGDYVVWERRVPLARTQVFRHHIPSRTTTRIETPAGCADSSPAVSSDGLVYLSRRCYPEGPGTAGRVEIIERPLAAAPRVVISEQFGHDALDLFVDDRASGVRRLYYVHGQYFNEDPSEYDVYRLTLPAPAQALSP